MNQIHSFLYIIFTLFSTIFIIYDVIFHSRSISAGIYYLARFDDGIRTNLTLPQKASSSSYSRKLLIYGACTNRDISVSQSRYLTRGIPKFIVEIVNTCVSGCSPSNIHLHCGWFASATLVNPSYFKRLSYDDCLVNGGRPLRIGQIIKFTYSNSFIYPLSFKTASFC